MNLNLSYEMIHALMRASQRRQDELENNNRADKIEYELLNQFEEMACDILAEANQTKQFSFKTINCTAEK